MHSVCPKGRLAHAAPSPQSSVQASGRGASGGEGGGEGHGTAQKQSRRFDAPGERDVPVRSVFTQPMFEKLKASMAAQGWAGIDAVEEVWESDLASRPIVSGFLKDKALGAKRLTSMPDRITNTISGDFRRSCGRHVGRR